MEKEHGKGISGRTLWWIKRKKKCDDEGKLRRKNVGLKVEIEVVSLLKYVM
jgi:hypothetical protein